MDILYSNGDVVDYAPPNSRVKRPVVENKQRSSSFTIGQPRAPSSPQAADIDGDGDLDVVVVTENNDWDNPQAPSLVWLENNGRMQFTLHALASSPTHLITLATGDLNGDGRPDLVTGGMHITRPYDRMGRVTAWINRGAAR